MQNDPILVIGATGKTGRRVATQLETQGHTVRRGSRNSATPFDWEAPETWAPALTGAKSAYVTYFPDLAFPGAVEKLESLVETAKSSGVEKLVLLSGRGEHHARLGEEVVQNSGLIYTLVRAAWFAHGTSSQSWGRKNGRSSRPSWRPMPIRKATCFASARHLHRRPRTRRYRDPVQPAPGCLPVADPGGPGLVVPARHAVGHDFARGGRESRCGAQPWLFGGGDAFYGHRVRRGLRRSWRCVSEPCDRAAMDRRDDGGARLDRAGHRRLRVLESGPGFAGCLFVRRDIGPAVEPAGRRVRDPGRTLVHVAIPDNHSGAGHHLVRARACKRAGACLARAILPCLWMRRCLRTPMGS